MIVFPARVELSPLAAEEHGRGLFEVAARFPVRFQLFGQEIVYWVEAGRRTEGASRPWWASRWFDPWGRDGLPAILHDDLLANPAVTLPKWLIDLILLWALRSAGRGELHATLMFLAVRTRRRPAAARAAVAAAALLAGCTFPLAPRAAIELHFEGQLRHRAGATRPKTYTGLRASVVTERR